MESTAAETPSMLRRLQELSVPLLTGVLAALVFANLAPHAYHAMLHAPLGAAPLSMHFLVNDVFMALFFGIAAKEITESCLPGGALHPLRRAVNPLLGTLGGVIGPAVVYIGFCMATGHDGIVGGWGIPTATDIAMAWLVARLAFGAGHPAVSFLLLLAVADDAIGLGIIAVFYPNPLHPVQPEYLLLVAGASGLAYAMKRREVRSFWPYLLGPGVLSWFGLHLGSLHPALALVAVVPFMPSAGHDEGLFVELLDDVERADTLNRFERFFRIPVDFGLFFFGLANAGVEMSSVGAATAAVFLALLVGKTLGIFTFSAIGHVIGFALPEGMNYRSLFAAGVNAALGLTVALFVAGVAFTDPVQQGAAKMGALASAIVGPIAIVVARLVGARRIEPAVEVEPATESSPA